MLELAAAALGKVTARRHLMVRAIFDVTIFEHQVTRHRERHVAAAFGDAIAAGGDAHDHLAHSTAGIAAARSSAIIPGPATSAARPWIHTPAQAASKASRPRARIAAMIPASTSPVPALAS